MPKCSRCGKDVSAENVVLCPIPDKPGEEEVCCPECAKQNSVHLVKFEPGTPWQVNLGVSGKEINLSLSIGSTSLVINTTWDQIKKVFE